MYSIPKIFFLFIFSMHLNLYSKANDRKEAANLVNTINRSKDTLAKLELTVSRYFNKILMLAKPGNKYQPGVTDVDSLEYYYKNLIAYYDSSIRKVYTNKAFDLSARLKQDFLRLLKKGKEPWVMTIPVYLRGFRNGWSSLNLSEKNSIDSVGPVFRNAAETTEKRLKRINSQMDILINKYGLKKVDGIYR